MPGYSRRGFLGLAGAALAAVTSLGWSRTRGVGLRDDDIWVVYVGVPRPKDFDAYRKAVAGQRLFVHATQNGELLAPDQVRVLGYTPPGKCELAARHSSEWPPASSYYRIDGERRGAYWCSTAEYHKLLREFNAGRGVYA